MRDVPRERAPFFNFDNLAFVDFDGTDLLRLVDAREATIPNGGKPQTASEFAKMYAIDRALVRANSFGPRDFGLELETLVYVELRRRGFNPNYDVSNDPKTQQR